MEVDVARSNRFRPARLDKVQAGNHDDPQGDPDCKVHSSVSMVLPVAITRLALFLVVAVALLIPVVPMFRRGLQAGSPDDRVSAPRLLSPCLAGRFFD